MTDTRPPALHFELDDSGDRLVAHFDPTVEAAVPPGPEDLLEALTDAGHGDLRHLDDAIAHFVELAGRASQPVQLEIAERCDGECRIVVAPDAMCATLEVVPPFGGVPVDRAAVDRALAGAGVVSGIVDESVQQALVEASARPSVVARGCAPEAGTPVQFQSLIPDADQRRPSVDARGIANYRELGTLVLVHVGDPLMRRVPAKPGRAGTDVFGAVLPAPQHEDRPFSQNLSGASPSRDDPDLLIADIAGQPVVLRDGVSVQPTINLAAVDLSSGNIDFDGTVNIEGHVASGMRIVATGDVFVGGHVEAAYIEAGGNLSVAAGAIGCFDASDPGANSKVQLHAGGTVSVRFCEHAVIQAGGDVQIDEVSLHSELTAGQQILVGKPAGRRSQLIGGIARCAVRLQVGTLGSSAAVHTEVEVGFNPRAHAQLAAVQHQMDDITTRIESVHQVLAYTEAMTDPRHVEIRERAQRSLEAAEHERDALRQQLDAAQALVVLVEHARIVVREAVHPNVDIRLGGKCVHTQDTGAGRVYELHGGEIVLAAENCTRSPPDRSGPASPAA